jgi:hypothetical protein
MEDEDIEALFADLTLRREVEDFVQQEAALLDDGRLPEWAALFGGDGVYWVAASPDQQNPLDGSSPFFGDPASVRAAFPERPGNLRSVRSVGSVRIENRNAKLGAFEVSAAFVLAERRGDTDALTAGRYDFALLRSGPGQFRIAAKRVSVLVGSAAARDYPF